MQSNASCYLGMHIYVVKNQAIKNQATSPLAGIQNKENFPFHQPGLFIDFWA